MSQQTLTLPQNKSGAKLIRFLLITSIFGAFILLVRILTSVLLIAGMFGGILFLAAGRIDWLEAWVLTGIYGVFLFSFMMWAALYAPDLLRERNRMAGNVKPWDKMINLTFTLAFITLLVVSGLDSRKGWSVVHVLLQLMGVVGITLSCMIILWTMRINAFLSRWARIQNDRGHQVVSTGPYRFVRHPMYSAIIVFILSAPLELGSWWAVIPSGLAVLIYVARTQKEDQMLREELHGYREYASKVRYRLIPGLW